MGSKAQITPLKIVKIVIIIAVIAAIAAFALSRLLDTGELRYSLSDDGTFYVVTGYDFGPIKKVTEIEIPSTYKGKPVEAIAPKAFYSEIYAVGDPSPYHGIEKFHLPNSIKFIGEDAFKNTAFYDNENNWDIRTLKKDNGGKIECSRSLYVDKHLVKVILNESAYNTAGNESISVSYEVKEGTVAISFVAFEQKENLEISKMTIKIPSSVRYVGKRLYQGSSPDAYKVTDTNDRMGASAQAFDLNCINYSIIYGGTKAQWFENEHTAGLSVEELTPGSMRGRGGLMGNLHDGSYKISCQDGEIDLWAIYYDDNASS